MIYAIIVEESVGVVIWTGSKDHDHRGSDILVDLRFFPNTQNTTYWTSVSLLNNPSLAYEVPFFFGGSIVRDKSIDTHTRLVRSAD